MTFSQSANVDDQNVAHEPLDYSSTQSYAQSGDDTDEIDPVWLSKVEGLFHTYADNPHALAAGFNELKIEYIQNRYGKKIKKANEQ